MSADTFVIPPVADVNFHDPMEVEGYGHLLASAYRNFGGFATLPPRSEELVTIRRNAEKWILAVEKILAISGQGKISRLVTWYDILHRIAFGRPGPKKYFSPRLNLSPASSDRFTRLAIALDNGAIGTGR